MKWRKITPQEVKAVIVDPDFEKPYPLNPDITGAYKRIGKRAILVSYKDRRDVKLIITVVDKRK